MGLLGLGLGNTFLSLLELVLNPIPVVARYPGLKFRTPALSFDARSIPTPEEGVNEALRNVLPCYLELSCYISLVSKYEVVGWEGQPHDKDVIQVPKPPTPA